MSATDRMVSRPFCAERVIFPDAGGATLVTTSIAFWIASNSNVMFIVGVGSYLTIYSYATVRFRVTVVDRPLTLAIENTKA